MTASEIRESFLKFFESKQHRIVPSAPMVVKDDPTLMFTNAGMNQFKDIFLGNRPAEYLRVANSQKCLRVSGKHNDLEEVGHDTYHHTMFEMLGNWSFGDYFKHEAIDWAWEYLVDVLKIDPDRLYATVFEGNAEEGLVRDSEAFEYWSKHLPAHRIVNGNKKDNFWEMGDTGPCGPCSEIHIDLRDPAARAVVPGEQLVNKDNPEVIEIWNLVFIQYNRKADGSLESLPQRHIDTGMGFERLTRAIQGKTSNYDTDVFQPIIQEISNIAGIKYGAARETDVAMRVVADHIRTISFAICDGQLPSNNKAGYVIRRILRRAVRYAYTFLGMKEPFMCRLVETLISVMGKAYAELAANRDLIEKVIREEEESFLRTLATGIQLLDKIIEERKQKGAKTVEGKQIFELYDTFGFPYDLTELILRENGLEANHEEFEKEMEAQKARARNATAVETDDWVVLRKDDTEEFIGYDHLEAEVEIVKYRRVKSKNKELYQIVFNITPFYAESGGQVGDCGYIEAKGERWEITEVKKENNLIVHLAPKLPTDVSGRFNAVVDVRKRQMTANHHTATHLLHKALRKILGTHVEQRGSLVHPDYLRFDFSHFQKMSDEEIRMVEREVNREIRMNLPLEEHRAIPIARAKEMGAMALFGEKYGDVVRAIRFGESVELCGGTHVSATGQIGMFKIVAESSVAAGVRRIEAVAGEKAEELMYAQTDLLRELAEILHKQKDLRKGIESLVSENAELMKEVETFKQGVIQTLKRNISDDAKVLNGVKLMHCQLKPIFSKSVKDIAFQLRSECDSSMAAVLGVEADGKAQIAIIISEELVEKGLDAIELIKAVSPEINGGGGGQKFFATAGGKNPSGLQTAISKALRLIEERL